MDEASAPVDPTLLEALRVFRAAAASEAGVPAYVVAHDRTLTDIAARRPTSLDELSSVHGMGPVKIDRYGKRLVEVVRRAMHAQPDDGGG